MSAPKPKAVQAPFQQTNTNTYGYESQDPNNPWVQAYLDAPIDVDPGVKQRTDLAQQANENKWNNAFTAGIPQQVRMMQQGAEDRDIQQQGSRDTQQAKYLQNQLKLMRAQSLLPQLVQTGGNSSGFQTQVLPGQPGLFSSILSSFAGGFGSGLGATK